MSNRRAVDESFALRALSMSQHVIPQRVSSSSSSGGVGDHSRANTSAGDALEEDELEDTTVSQQLYVLSKRASDMADAAFRAEKEVDTAEAEFEACRAAVARHAEALAAAQRGANEAQLVLQIRKGEYEDAVATANHAHYEYGEFFKQQTEAMFASKAVVPQRRVTGAPSSAIAGPSSSSGALMPWHAQSDEGSNKRPRLTLEPPTRGSGVRLAAARRAGAAAAAASVAPTPPQAPPADEPMFSYDDLLTAPGAGADDGSHRGSGGGNGPQERSLVYHPEHAVGNSSRAGGGRGASGSGGLRASVRGGASPGAGNHSNSANPANEALPTAPPYFRVSTSSSSSSSPNTTGPLPFGGPSRGGASAQAATLARQLLKAKASEMGGAGAEGGSSNNNTNNIAASIMAGAIAAGAGPSQSYSSSSSSTGMGGGSGGLNGYGDPSSMLYHRGDGVDMSDSGSSSRGGGRGRGGRGGGRGRTSRGRGGRGALAG
ncbi:hypothetical protein OC844_005690 [Tilletia horrida]|nr:hypothetical protein OC844_005690 [Tilletia horrida]